MQYTENFSPVKIEIFIRKILMYSIIFMSSIIFAQNVSCGYTLEPSRRGGSNEYPQSMFWGKIKKNTYILADLSFAT